MLIALKEMTEEFRVLQANNEWFLDKVAHLQAERDKYQGILKQVVSTLDGL